MTMGASPAATGAPTRATIAAAARTTPITLLTIRIVLPPFVLPLFAAFQFPARKVDPPTSSFLGKWVPGSPHRIEKRSFLCPSVWPIRQRHPWATSEDGETPRRLDQRRNRP